MLDPQLLRENPEKIKESIQKRGLDIDLERIKQLDERKRELLRLLEEKRAEQNKITKEISQNPEKKELLALASSLKEEIEKIEREYKKINDSFWEEFSELPNLISPDVPYGESEEDNLVLRSWGDPPKFDFQPKDHLELGESLDIIDVKKASQVAGSRFSYLKREGALLEFALIQFVLDTLLNENIISQIAKSVSPDFPAKTFIPVVPPVFIKPEVFFKMARLYKGDREERYYLEKDDLYLIGSAEHTLGPLEMNETLREEDLPLRYLGFSTCFRREAGSYGKDVRGILRQHQFDKLEMESFTLPELSLLEQEFHVKIQEYLLQKLKLPYRVVLLCSQDMGKPDFRQIDIEVYLPSQKRYRETHSSDLMIDFQSRRLNIKLKRKNSGKKEFVHMADATALAIGRTIIAILENYQQKDGSIEIPEVLLPYMHGISKISRK